MCKEFDSLPKIIAVDFDGTLVEDKWPKIGEPKEELFQMLKILKEKYGVKIILWTCRNNNEKYGSLLQEAVDFCQEKGLIFDSVNEDLKEAIELSGGSDSRKIHADIYIDDKATCSPSTPFFWIEKLGANWIDVMKAVFS